MSYMDRFKHADDIITHLDAIVPSLTDNALKAKYAGLLAVAGVTVYELAIKDIFFEFADKKHAVLGVSTRVRFERINGQIKLEDLMGKHIHFFGEKYETKFRKKIEDIEIKTLKAKRVSVKSSYKNLIVWRHNFAHSASIMNTYEEVKDAYFIGQEVIHCLNETMKR